METISQNRSQAARAIVAADVDHLVHPSSLVKRAAEDALIFESASGIRISDIDGNEWLDMSAGLVNVTVGYGRHELADAAADALRTLSYANPYFGRGSVKPAQLAAKLAEITPAGLERFFFTTGGADANETTIKLARCYNILRGKPEKIHIIGRTRGYHGATIGSWSLSGNEAAWERFGPRLPGFSHIPQPGPEVGAEALEEEILRVGPDKVAMFLAEPISTSRVNIPPDDYWPAMRGICTKYDVLLSLDEVITGFGRIGTMFAAEHWGVAPDLMQMSKGITSGYMPLGAVGLTEEIVDVLGSGGILPHGFTAGGHTAACAVALANIAIIEDESLVERGAAANERFRSILEQRIVGGGVFTGVRGLGSLTALDVDSELPEEIRARIDEVIMGQRLLVGEYGVWGVVAFTPSLSIIDDEIDEVVARLEAATGQL
jgi:adenosylmethionine-8-amino-7-oxononanoate aminotransferase